MLFEEKETTNEHELLQKDICYLYAKQWNRTRSYRLVAGTYSKSVFVRHYYKPDLARFEKVRSLLDNLYNQPI
jgi:hypothetical protein